VKVLPVEQRIGFLIGASDVQGKASRRRGIRPLNALGQELLPGRVVVDDENAIW